MCSQSAFTAGCTFLPSASAGSNINSRVHALKLPLSPEVRRSLSEVNVQAAVRWHQAFTFAAFIPSSQKAINKELSNKVLQWRFCGFIPVPAQRDESRHLAVRLIFFIDSFQNPAMEQALSGRGISSGSLHLALSQLAKNFGLVFVEGWFCVCGFFYMETHSDK